LTAAQYRKTLAALGLPLPAGDRAADAVFGSEVGAHGFRNGADRRDLTLPAVEQLVANATKVAETAAANPAVLASCLRANLGGDEACMRGFIADFGRKALRRPLSSVEQADALAYFESESAAQGAQGALVQLVRTWLLSPAFLFRSELGAPATAGATELDAYERASALSYLILDGPPDEALYKAAADGALMDPARAQAEARRLVRAAAGAPGLQEMFLEWWGADQTASVDKDPKVFPAWTAAVAQESEDTARLFVQHVLADPQPRWRALLTTESTILTDRVARLEGLPSGPKTPSWGALPAGQRAGLLTHPAFLASVATAAGTDVVHRGIFVRQRLLCGDLPPPPPDVNAVAPDPDPKRTRREQFEQQHSIAACATCHRLIDPLGLAFETYDGIGQYRTTENGKPIDPRGEIVGSTSTNVNFESAVDLAAKLAQSAEVSACAVRQAFRYAVGRRERDADRCLLDRLTSAFARTDGDLVEFVAAMAGDRDFFRRTAQ
jgi:hypothetical protein